VIDLHSRLVQNDKEIVFKKLVAVLKKITAVQIMKFA